MKQLFKKLQENARSIVEIIGLVMAFLIPYIINVKGLIALCFENVSVDFDNIGYYLLLNTENWVISILLWEIQYVIKEKNCLYLQVKI